MILKNGKRIDGLGDNMPIGSIVEYNGTDIPDGWEILPGDANVYVGPTEPTEGQDIWIQKGRNLIDIRQLIYNTALVGDGTSTPYADYFITPFIAVKPNTTYAATGFINASGVTNDYVEFFDKNHTFISNFNGVVFTTPENTAYIRFNSSTLNVDLTKIQVEVGEHTTEIEAYIDKKVYLKNSAGGYDLFVKNRVHTGPYQPEDGEEVWVQKSKNLFNINGNVNISGAGGGQTSLNTVSGNVLTSNVNTYSTHNVGQKFTNLKGKTFTVSAKILSVGTGTDGYTAIYDNNVLKKGLSVQAGQTVTLTYTGTTDNIVVGFATASGTGAQFTNIQVEIGDTATDYEPYVIKKIYTKNDNGYEEFYSGEGNVYSREERRIGTWVNGKPIYRKCFTLDTRIALGNGHTKMTTLAEQGIVDWEDITHISFMVKDDHAGYFSDGFYTDETDASRCWVSSDWVMFLCGTTYGCGDTTFIIEYTKTTD